jgi:hypothetical protein
MYYVCLVMASPNSNADFRAYNEIIHRADDLAAHNVTNWIVYRKWGGQIQT